MCSGFESLYGHACEHGPKGQDFRFPSRRCGFDSHCSLREAPRAPAVRTVQVGCCACGVVFSRMSSNGEGSGLPDRVCGFESRRPLAPIAQWQGSCFTHRRSGVRIPVGALGRIVCIGGAVFRGCGAVGSASRSQREGRGFESRHLHATVAQSGRRGRLRIGWLRVRIPAVARSIIRMRSC